MDKYILPDFFIIPTEIALDEDLQPLDGYVYAIVYWYTKLKLERCTASNQTIANILSTKFKTKRPVFATSVSHALSRLAKKKYIKIVMSYTNQRIEIIPLVSFSTESTPSSNEQGSKKSSQQPNPTTPSSNELPPLFNRTTPLAQMNNHKEKDIKSNNKQENTENTKDKSLEKLDVSRKVDQRNPAIQEGIEHLARLLNHPVHKETLNRYALKRLYAKWDKTTIFRAIIFAFQVRGEDRFAPKIYNYLDLEEKWDALVDYGNQHTKKKAGNVNISEMIRQKKGETTRVTSNS